MLLRHERETCLIIAADNFTADETAGELKAALFLIDNWAIVERQKREGDFNESAEIPKHLLHIRSASAE